MRRSGAAIALAGTAVTLAFALPAMATTAPQLDYDPPRILFEDLESDASSENVDVTKEGSKYRFVNTPVAPFSDDSECTAGGGGLECPVAGIEKIVVNLGDLADEGQINLGRRARRVRQVLRGQDDGDIILGERGPQKIYGGDGVDTLQGGAGADFINGGPGADTCSGGPGDDTVIHCEA